MGRCARWAASRLFSPCSHANRLLEKNAATDIAHIGPNRPVKGRRKVPFGSPVEKMARAGKLRHVKIRNGTLSSRGKVTHARPEDGGCGGCREYQWAYEHSESISKLLRSVVYTKLSSGVRSNPPFCETPQGRYTTRAALLDKGTDGSCRRRRETSDSSTSTAVTHPPHRGSSGGVAFGSRRKSRSTTHFYARCSRYFRGSLRVFRGSLSSTNPEEPP